MKKSILLALALPLILASCNPTSTTQNSDGNGSQSSGQTEGETSTGGGTETGGETGGGTEGSGTGGGSTTGGETGGQTGGGTTGGGSTTTDTGDVEFDFSKLTETSGEQNGVSYKAEKGSGATAPAINESGKDLRVYAKGTLTLNSDTNLTKVVFNISSQGKKRQADISVNSGTMSYNLNNSEVIWTGSSKNIVFTVGEKATKGTDGDTKAGQFCFTKFTVTKGTGTGGGTTGGGTTGGGTTGGGTTGGDIQAGNGNTSHSFTSPWEGIQKDIVYQMFKGNLPHLTDFNQYALGDWDGSTIPYFNPYIESNWSKDAQKDYDLALKEMGYSLTAVEPYVDGNGNEFPDTPVNCYSKGSFRVRTSHYAGSHNVWYFDVYAWNEYEPADPNFTVKSELDRSKITLKSGYQALNYSGGGYNYSANAVCKYSTYGMQFDAESEITITGDLHNINILFVENAYSCVVYAGSSASNLSPVYNDACNYKLPSGTKVVKIKTLEKECIIENIAVN